MLYLYAVALVMVVPDANACSCTQPPSRSGVAEAGEYGAVFAGNVIALRLDEDKSLPGNAEHRRHLVHAKIQVLGAWKGSRQAEVTVETDYFSGTCGYPFKLGESYLIYARGATEPYHVDFCSPTKPLATATAEATDLDERVAKRFRPPSN
jgi:hypothetical protein